MSVTVPVVPELVVTLSPILGMMELRWMKLDELWFVFEVDILLSLVKVSL